MDELTATLGELDRIRAVKAQLEEQCKALQSKALTLMGVRIIDNIIAGPKATDVVYDGMKVHAVVKASTKTEFDMDVLKDSLSPSMLTQVTDRVVNKTLWNAKVEEGKIPPEVIKAAVQTSLGTPYIQTNSKPAVAII